ncbi:MAG: SAM-dependent methyltransferase [Desulfobacteraceae bacterium]|jgi:precorrin-4 methylase
MKHPLKTPALRILGFVLALVLTAGCAKAVKTASENPGKKGTYHVVGIGPGDVDLMTEKARAAIQSADIVFANPKTQEKLSSVIDFKGKEVVDGYGVLFRFYGKDCKAITEEQKNNPRSRMSCEEYQAKQADYVKRVREAVLSGKNVVLLSSGDPTIYGPDIWNLKELADLSPTLVPGLSSFNAATAALKVSLGEVIITAPFKGKDGELSKDSLENLVKKDKATVVIFMPRDLKELMVRLRSSCDARTPMAVVSSAGMKGKEKTILGTVGDMEKKLEGEDMNMCLVYVGKALENAHVKDRPAGENMKKGKFYLVGAGPGDADLATLRALSVLKKADMIFSAQKISDRFKKELEGKQIIDGYHRLFPFYGKKCADVTDAERKNERMGCEEYHKKQEAVATMVRKAVAEGKNVAMLDSGDPLIYGPCSWTLAEFKDIETEVVPGLSCFNAANAALKQGVTEGKTSHSVILASGWTVAEMAELQGTMVLFTMRTEFKTFIDTLSKNYPADTPVAIVESAGYAAKEKVLRSTLGTILNDTSKDKLPFEYLLYVGDFLKGEGKI